jgi:hypothetical protein
MAPRALTPTVRGFAQHPITRTRERDDWDAYRRAADTAAAIEAELAKVRRLAGREPPQVFARTIELAAHEVQITAARYWSREVAVWKQGVLQELGGLLFRHVGDLEISVSIGPDLRLARRDGY